MKKQIVHVQKSVEMETKGFWNCRNGKDWLKNTETLVPQYVAFVYFTYTVIMYSVESTRGKENTGPIHLNKQPVVSGATNRAWINY